MDHVKSLTAAILLLCAFAVLLFGFAWSSHQATSIYPTASTSAYGHGPFPSGWESWFDPFAWPGQYSQATNAGKIDSSWNILYHLGGNGPWIQKIEGVVTDNITPPRGCHVEQVHMLARHGERYPTKKSGRKMMDLITKLNSTRIAHKGKLDFVRNWPFFVDDPEVELEQLTTTGPYSGSLEVFETGVKLRTRYRDLLPSLIRNKTNVRMWASGSDRVEQTARYLRLGLFGLPMHEFATIQVIPETPDQGGNTLTPADSCLAYQNDPVRGHDSGALHLKKFQSVYLPKIAKRLEKELGVVEGGEPTILLNENIYSMQEICGFEINAKGRSPWCDVFTKKEWESFEYARDLSHFYRSGPGNKYSRILGSLWLNATAKLLEQGPRAGPLFLSFTHDTDIIPVVTALDLFHDDKPLPTTHVYHSRKWKTSQVVPMGGRLILERLACDAGSSKGSYIRVNVNDGIVPLPGCIDGPGKSCSLHLFLKSIQKLSAAVGDFRTACKLSTDAPGEISFLHQF